MLRHTSVVLTNVSHYFCLYLRGGEKEAMKMQRHVRTSLFSQYCELLCSDNSFECWKNSSLIFCAVHNGTASDIAHF